MVSVAWKCHTARQEDFPGIGHTLIVQHAVRAKFDVKVRSGAGYVGDRLLISQFTCEDEAKLDRFSDNSPDCMANDQIKCEQFLEESSWVGLYDTFKQRKPSRKTNSGFINGIKSSSENVSQENIRNAINLQLKIMKAIAATNGGHTDCMICGSMS